MSPIKKLQIQLQKASNERTKKWFENYLKNVITYRGVKSPKVVQIVAQWRSRENLHEWPLDKQLKLACDLIRQKKAEDKFAGTIYIQKYLHKKINPKTLLKIFNQIYVENCFWDWSTTDSFCIRVLDPLIIAHGQPTADIIAKWRKSQNLWQRRSSIVSFRRACTNKKYHSLIKKIIADLVKEDQRFIQTAIGWVISDLSKHDPVVATKIVKKHFNQLSSEVIQRHTKHLPDHKTYKALRRKIPDRIY